MKYRFRQEVIIPASELGEISKEEGVRVTAVRMIAEVTFEEESDEKAKAFFAKRCEEVRENTALGADVQMTLEKWAPGGPGVWAVWVWLPLEKKEIKAPTKESCGDGCGCKE